jgi:23S rRNA (uracil1939-C5)-methyltransferase
MNEGYVVGIASEGQGIVRQDGLVTFIPFTATHDKIRYQTVQQKKNFAIGKLIDLIEPSPERIVPKCRYFGTCGGCQLQHIQYQAQLEYKRKWIEDALKKIGKFQISVPPVTPAKAQWAYRRRINLVLKWDQGSFKAGYFATDNTSLVEVESCPIFIEEQDPILKHVQEISRQLTSRDPTDGKVTILKNSHGYIAHFHFKTLPENAEEVFSHSSFRGILASSRKKSLQFGTIETSCVVEGLEFTFNPKTFIQAHPEQSGNIYREIDNLGKILQPKRALDCYCGIGISTLLLARQGCETTGVELNTESIKLAKANAIKNGLKAEFLTADVEKILASLLESKKPDLIILNPPREGLTPKIIQLIHSKPSKHLIYVSCMPATLARDLKSLCEKNYQISSVQAFDMFPQTVHVETLVYLIQNEARSVLECGGLMPLSCHRPNDGSKVHF